MRSLQLLTSATAAAVLVSVMDAAPAAEAQSTPWHSIGPAPPAVITPVVVDRATGVVHIATFGGGVLKSTDEGRSFTTANTGLTSLAVTAMATHPRDAGHLYVFAFDAGFFETRDAGARWTPLTNPGPVALSIAVDPLRSATLYVGLLGGARLRKSTDGGATWTDANAGLPNAPVWSVQIDRQNPDVLYAGTGGGGAFRSMDGGASWVQMPLPTNVLAIAVDPRDNRIVYAGTDGQGLYRSFDAGRTFAAVGRPGSGRVLSLALDPSRQGVVYAGTLHYGVEVSTDFAQTFSPTAFSRGSALALSNTDTGDVYVGTSFSGVLKSGSYGALWSPVAADLLESLKGQNVYGLTVDPQNSARLLAATNEGGMLETTDGGRTWRASDEGFTSHTARAAVFDPADLNRVYAGTFPGGGVQVSNDAGRTWTQRVFGSPAIYVWSVAVRP